MKCNHIPMEKLHVDKCLLPYSFIIYQQIKPYVACLPHLPLSAKAAFTNIAWRLESINYDEELSPQQKNPYMIPNQMTRTCVDQNQ